jgi:hypothetical protein
MPQVGRGWQDVQIMLLFQNIASSGKKVHRMIIDESVLSFMLTHPAKGLMA